MSFQLLYRANTVTVASLAKRSSLKQDIHGSNPVIAQFENINLLTVALKKLTIIKEAGESATKYAF